MVMWTARLIAALMGNGLYDRCGDKRRRQYSASTLRSFFPFGALGANPSLFELRSWRFKHEQPVFGRQRDLMCHRQAASTILFLGPVVHCPAIEK